MQYKCPKADCPATEFPPVDVTSSTDQVPTAVCGGQCSQEYPRAAFRRVR